MLPTVVLGAGIVGAAAAAQLAGAGAAVTVIDDERPGRATAAGAGIISAISSRVTGSAEVRFRLAAARHYHRLINRLQHSGFQHSFGRVGQLSVALDDADVQRLGPYHQRCLDIVEEFGPDAVGRPELLDERAVRTRFPLLRTALGGVLLPGIGRVDGRILRDALLADAVRHGAQVVSGGAELLTENGDWLLQVSGQRMQIDQLLVAAGAWSGPMLSALGVRIDVQPQRGQLLHLELPGISALPAVDSFAGHYLLPFPADRVVIGATRESGSGFAPRLTAGGIAEVLANGMSLVPDLVDARWLETRVGLRPLSADGLPVLGGVPARPGLWLATGMGPSGLSVGPYSGALVADLMLGGGTLADSVPLPAAFDPGRFAVARGA